MNRLHIKQSVLLTFILCLSSLNAQNTNLKFSYLSINEGLSNSSVTCIYQDRQGFMWFGTQDGLNKYDGYEFTHYTHNTLNSTSISDNFIRSITETQDGFLWVATENGGLNRFNVNTQTFRRFQHHPGEANSISSNSIRVIYADPYENVLWIGGNRSGIDKLDLTSQQFSPIETDEILKNDRGSKQVTSLYRDTSGKLWVGTLNGLYRFDKTRNTWKHFNHHPNQPKSISHSEVYSILEDKNKTLWFGTLNGLNRYVDGHFINQNINQARVGEKAESNYIRAIIQDQNNNYWTGTNTGLKHYSKNANEVFRFEHASGDPGSLSNNGINCIYEDRSGLIWIGTEAGGINIISPNSAYFQSFKHIPGNPNSLSHPSIRGIYEDQGGLLWVGGYGGLNRIDRKTGEYINYSPRNLNNYLGTLFVYSVIGDREKRQTLWLGTEGQGLIRFNKQTGSSKQYFYHKTTAKAHDETDELRGGNFVFDLYQDLENILWVASFNGLKTLNPKTGEISHYPHNPNDNKSLSGNDAVVVTGDKAGFIWVGTEANGLNRFDRTTEQFVRFSHVSGDPSTISNDRIKSIYEDSQGVLWIGTNGGGLNRFDRETESFKAYRVEDGLPNNVIYGILEDEAGNLWISTNLGLSKFNPQLEKFYNYDVRDGLQSNEFNTRSYFKSKSGEMFFGGINGFNSFYPNKLKEDTFQPPVVITDFKILNKSVPLGELEDGRVLLEQHISTTRELNLSYKDAVLSFEFVALTFIAPTKNSYAYKMEGIEEDWVLTTAGRRFATYTHLLPGTYIFRVKASNQDGTWNESGVSLKIHVAPPFWKTWWAYTIYVISTALIVMIVFQWRVWRMKQRNRELEQTVAKRTREIKKQYTFLQSTIESLSHPFYVIDATSYKIILANSAAGDKVETDKMTCHERFMDNPEVCEHCLINQVKQNGKPHSIEREHGNKVYLVNAFPIFNGDNQVVQVIKYWLDITAQKELENTLKNNLEKRNKELTSKAMRMARDKEVLVELVEDVKSLYGKAATKEKAPIRSLMNRLSDQVRSENEWGEFELWFQEVHKDFYSRLLETSPGLSQREMKVCAFLKLNLSTKEIANITNLTPKTIEVYRSNLRKKLGVPVGENLVKFINDI